MTWDWVSFWRLIAANYTPQELAAYRRWANDLEYWHAEVAAAKKTGRR